MNLYRSLITLAVSAIVLTGCNKDGQVTRATEVPADDTAKVSYSLGQNIANSLKSSGLELDNAYLFAGFLDAMEDKQLLTAEEMQQSLMSAQMKAQQKQMEEVQKMANENAEAGAAYMSENANKEGVVTTESGLQYQVLEAADGPKPTASDTVTVNYEGRLIDGTVFDSSYERGQAATFPLGGVIAGWTEALQLMPVGSKYELTIPADLAYGQRGSPPAIGPNATLVFTVELLEIQAPASDEAAEG